MQAIHDQLKRLPPLPTSLPALNATNAVLAKARGSLLAEDTVALLRDSLSSDSRTVREAALKVCCCGAGVCSAENDYGRVLPTIVV